MSEAPERSEAEEQEGPARTPFDNPYFLPVLMWLATGWFFWDAWIVPLEGHERFNRYGFGFLLGMSIYVTTQSVSELRGGPLRIPYLFAVLMLVYAGWLAFLGWLAPADRWYNDEPVPQLFNRWGTAFFVACAAVSALRERLRRGRAEPAS